MAAAADGLTWEMEVRRGGRLSQRRESEGGSTAWTSLGFFGRRTDSARIAYDTERLDVAFVVFTIDLATRDLPGLRMLEATVREHVDPDRWRHDSSAWESAWDRGDSLFGS
jgi:hypothetical protein